MTNGDSKIIGPFRGEYRWLSNFWPCKVYYDGDTYSSVEHAYQASKTIDLKERKLILVCAKPGQAKRLGRRIVLRDDFLTIRLDIMRNLLRRKFCHDDLREKLLATGDTPISEINNWGDTFWGVCDSSGANHLGKLIMEVREELSSFHKD